MTETPRTAPLPEHVHFLCMQQCDHCGCSEERVLTDSFTGKALCVHCLWPILGHLAGAPASEGDNLNSLLKDV